MLNKLYISNYALIRDLSIEFSDGFSVITGETGSGKSIILGAIQLLTGSRSPSKPLDQSKKSIVEGVFKSNKAIDDLLINMDFDRNDDLILRKEIKPNGSSRSFINDSPAKVEQLKIVTQNLIELNGQHLINKIGKLNFNYDFVDGFIKDTKVLNRYNNAYLYFLKYSKRNIELKKSALELIERKDFLTFQLEELEQLSIDNWDEEALNNEYNLISNQKELNSNLKQINYLYNSENGIANQLLKFTDLFEKLNLHIKELSPFIERINSTRIDIEDLFQELNAKYSFQNSSPERLDELNELLKQINFSLKKFNVVDVPSLIIKRDKIVHSISQLKDIDQEIIECENKKNHWEKECIKIGISLMEARLENFKFIEQKVNSVLKSISMDHADFKLRIKKSNNISSYGIDSLELLISVNNKNEYFPINKFSSGGELSRIALAMKSVASSSKYIPILIFDEIDTGISGKVASEVGSLLKEISKKVQVINITHLPQVAAFAKTHYHVEKADNGMGMESSLTVLERENRIQILAKMLGGDKTGKAARNNALELLN